MRVPESLRRFDPRRPSATVWNGLIDFVLRNRAHLDLSSGGREPFRHPWLVEAERWTDAPVEAKADPERAWKLTVEPATVNDEQATMVYRRQGDVRGWVMPEDYPAPKQGQAGYHPVFVDRPLFDAGGDGPFLVLDAPAVGTPAIPAGGRANQFVSVPEGQRLVYFRTEEMMERALYVAFVLVSAEPGVVERYLPGVRLSLRRFRVFAGQRPTNAQAYAGAYRELARLYLTREKSGRPSEDKLYVQQRVFWCLGAYTVTPTVPPLPGTGGLDPIADLLVDTAQSRIDEMTESAAFGEFWTS